MVAKLIAEQGTLEGLVLWLDVGDEWIVGRDPDEAQLVVEDPKVSRRHAVCRRTDEGIVIENVSNTNLLLANGVEILEPYLLREDDEIQMGDTLFRFTTGTEGEEAIPPVAAAEEEEPYDEIFGAPPAAAPAGAPERRLTPLGRWLLKVVAGPNTGAELDLEPKHSYTLGTDADSCDVVFHDLSVSRQHARIDVSAREELTIEDLHSRNGVIVDGQEISERTALAANSVVNLGTTSLVLIDREAAQETIISAAPPEGAESEEEPFPSAEEPVARKRRPVIAGGTFLLLLIGLGIAVVAVTGGFSLFKTEEVARPRKDYAQEIQHALADFPDVRFTFNPSSGTLFLLGHVLTPIDRSELFYNLQELKYIGNVDDNVVVDQYIWEETNTILAKNSAWTGVSMHAPIPGHFVLTGYLKTRQQYGSLNDYLRLNFPYIDRLDNQVVVEELLLDEITAQLTQAGFTGVQPELDDGSLALKGFARRTDAKKWQQLVERFEHLRGIRNVRNFVVLLSQEQSLVDLTGRYQVQGYADRNGDIISVLINGQIVGVSDTFQGMTITRLTATTIYLEKDGVKYKIDYKQ